MRFFYAMGYRTREAAEIALEDLFAAGEVSEGEKPIIKPYSNDNGQCRWGIELNG